MKYCIFVGINKYSPHLGAGELSQCWYDVERIKERFNGLAQSTMLDGGATVAALRNTFEGLAAKMVEGDTLFYFQSSHGTAIEYMNTRTKTGRVMYDGILWDDVFILWLSKFKKGVTVVTVSDMCHAESNSRKVRTPDVLEKFLPCPDWAIPTGRDMPNLLNNAGVKCSRIHVGACKVDQTAKELQYSRNGMSRGGVFTTAILDNWSDTVKKTVDAAKAQCLPFEQTPTIETNRVNKSVLNKVNWQ